MWPYSQVNLDRMALQLALTKANPRRLYSPKMVLDLGWFSLVERRPACLEKATTAAAPQHPIISIIIFNNKSVWSFFFFFLSLPAHVRRQIINAGSGQRAYKITDCHVSVAHDGRVQGAACIKREQVRGCGREGSTAGGTGGGGSRASRGGRVKGRGVRG